MKVDAAPPQWAIDMLMGRVVARVRAETPSEDEPPVALAGDALERWYGRLIGHRNADGSVARGLCLWDIGCDLEHAGATRRTVRAAVEERDGTLGWDKFNVRNDAEIRYDDIVTNVFTGQTPRVRLKKAETASKHSRVCRSATGLDASAQEIAKSRTKHIAWYAPGHCRRWADHVVRRQGQARGQDNVAARVGARRAYGEDFLGQPTQVHAGGVPDGAIRASFRRNLSRAGLLDRADLHALMWSRIENPEWRAIVAEACAQARTWGAGLMIIDTLPQFAALRGEDENKSGAILEMMKPLQGASRGWARCAGEPSRPQERWRRGR